MTSPLWLQRILAGIDWIFAASVTLPCGSTLYLILAGKFNNYWIADKASFARLQELGLILAFLAFVAGVSLWFQFRHSLFFETVLFPLKAYCAYFFMWDFGMSNNPLFLAVPVSVLLGLGFLIGCWLRQSELLNPLRD